MRITAIILISALFPFASAHGQESLGKAIDMADEPHHTLVFQNDEVRVFRLKLQPGEVTLQHRHQAFYAYLSLRPTTIANEVRGRQPVLKQLEAGELHTSKGGFNLAERNQSSVSADLIGIEPKKTNGGSFTTPMGGFNYHDAAFGELFEATVMRGYTMVIAAGGRIEQHIENYDRLIVAISDMKLRETLDGGKISEFELKAGEVHWKPRGATQAVTNIGNSPASFITLEFN